MNGFLTRAQIEELLRGIDATESESESGWWDTSTGAEFGATVLKAILDHDSACRAAICGHHEAEMRWRSLYCHAAKQIKALAANL